MMIHEYLNEKIYNDHNVKKIHEIRNDMLSFGKRQITNLFMSGYCYEFAKILRDNIPNSKIVFEKGNKKGHYYLEYKGRYFDIEGEKFPNEENLEYDE